MHILVLAPDSYYRNWKNAFQRFGQKHQLYFCLEDALAVADKIEILLLWKQQPGELHHFHNLKAYYSMGAGVDHILADPSRSPHLPICRVIDPYMADDMGNFLVMAVLNYHRRFYEVLNNQQHKKWDNVQIKNIPVKIGIMGLGHLGQAIAKKLQDLSFDVYGLSQSPKPELSFPTFGIDALESFLQHVNTIIVLLPATPQTHHLINEAFIEKCTPGTYIINVARGSLVDIDALTDAVDREQLSGALLDVFPQEPLSHNSPLWEHPKIQVTPHLASITAPETAAAQIFENLDDFENGKPLIHQINLAKGY